MKNKLLFSSILIAAIATCFSACNKEVDAPDNTKNVGLDPTEYTYNNPVASDEEVALGRVLFYDGRLSVNSSIACATCHKQLKAFSDDSPFSLGFQNRVTQRNTLAIQNIQSSSFGGFSHLFWDGRTTDLDEMVLMPMMHNVEMGMAGTDAIVERIKSAPYYSDLFAKAFGTDDVNIEKVSSALAAFTGSIASSNTLFDKHMAGEATLNGEQQLGFQLFFTKYNCNSCHQVQELNGYQMGGSFSNIGLDEEYTDNGLGAAIGDPAANGMFRIPNLRNVALTGPYMHDGRFATLEEVIDHYSHGVANHPNLDIRLQDVNGAAAVLNITEKEKSALIAFMHTLTDYTMITDPKFSSPFK